MGLFKLKIHNQIYFYLFLVLAFFIPVHDKFVPPIILLIGLNWILEFNFREKYSRIKHSVQRKNILAFGSIYMLYVIGVFYSSQLKGQEGALFDLEIKMSLLIFPLLFSTIDFSSFKKSFFKQIVSFFVVGSLFSGMVLFGFSVYDYFERGNDTTAFFYTNFAHWNHPSYMAMYYAFSIGILVNRLIQTPQKKISKKLITYILIFIFQILIVLLSSKAGILATVLMYIVAFVYLIIKKNRGIRNRFWIPGVLLISFFIVLLMFPRSYGRFVSVKNAVEQEGSLPTNTHESSAARILIWKSAFEVIKANPVFGVGTGDVKQELRKVYKEKKIEGAYEDHLNAHNQYIQTTVALGIVGLLVLLLSLLLPAVFSFRGNSLLYLLFIVLVSFHFLVESMLERQAGVVFYAFFNSLLFYFMAWDNRKQNMGRTN